jgi:tetratricopeptide (TPR) repeat protein
MPLHRCLLIIVLLGRLALPITAQEDPADTPPALIRLSYFNAVDDLLVEAFFERLEAVMLEYDYTLDYVTLEDGDPQMHILFRPVANRSGTGQTQGGVTYVLNLFESPLHQLSHGLRPVLTDRAVLFSADPQSSAELTAGVLLFMFEECEFAVKIFDTIIEDQAETIPATIATFYRGTCAVMTDDQSAAITDLEAVLYDATGDYYGSTALNLAYAYIQDDRPQDSHTLLEDVVTSLETYDAGYADFLTGKAVLLAQELEDPARALLDLELALAATPNFAPAFFERGRIYQEQGNQEQAAQAFAQYLELAPDGPYAEEAREFLAP